MLKLRETFLEVKYPPSTQGRAGASFFFFVLGQLIFLYYPGTLGQWPVFILFLFDLSHFAARFARLSFMSCEYKLFIIIHNNSSIEVQYTINY